MTVTSLAWVAVASRLALAGVRFVHPARPRGGVVEPAGVEPTGVEPAGACGAPVPAGTSGPAPRARSQPDDDGWRPRVSSGCGR